MCGVVVSCGMGAKGSVEAAKINAQNWNSLEVRVLQGMMMMLVFLVAAVRSNSYPIVSGFVLRRSVGVKRGDGRSLFSQTG